MNFVETVNKSKYIATDSLCFSLSIPEVQSIDAGSFQLIDGVDDLHDFAIIRHRRLFVGRRNHLSLFHHFFDFVDVFQHLLLLDLIVD